ncbi:hypothetical protein COCC4DRAFT_37930 [Bipolaris maydis ATCC 48331]|uniref:Uncharacterized protein n=2 Tax=Cochliobolus heterostrophus TaxID=5016 RepID=M2UXD3_COCH5|nr:uncharacterized protein COCC4DRAFT_37930 [Bipolaris maydis ATCC 48331]EMD92488.1 hypothetical protein COCHEDRAFT_1213541 [Bipolaris maydis C5]ENI08182.1 hypothetical protein COCC4DRAFT_37930 [Bipolaris maydis ATCC 48331]KAH7552914.1 hypothetical protein BM1_07887 [Bipolaris maydis]
MRYHKPPHPSLLKTIPASDFKDLLTVALDLHTFSLDFLNIILIPREDDYHEPRDMHPLATAKGLLIDYDDLDREYGWVLASDHASVDRVLSRFCKAGRKPSEWFKEFVAELESVRGLLEKEVAQWEKVYDHKPSFLRDK